MFVTNRKDAKSDDYLTSHTYHPCVCANYIFPLCCDWWNSVGKMQRDRTRARIVEMNIPSYICVYERMIFMKAMPDNDVSSFFLSPSACDLILL